MPIKATFTGDVTDLRRATEQSRQEFRKVGTEAESASRQIKAVGSSLDGSKIEGAARRVASSIERIGGASKLTDSELAKSSRTISEVLQKYDRMGTEAPANIRKLGAELDALRQKSASLKDIGPPESAVKSFGLLQGAVAGVAAAITSQALSSVKSFTADVIEMAGGISDLAAKTGLTTTQVQQFGYAAAQTGSSVDVITNAVTQLSNRLVEGGTGTVAAVERLGLSFEELQRMDPGEAFTTIADAIAKVPDPMQQTQLAMELFGKAGAEILPAIKQGMSELAQEATRLGLVIDDSAIQALDNFGDAWDRAELQAKAAAAGILSDFLRVSKALSDLSAQGQGVAETDEGAARIRELERRTGNRTQSPLTTTADALEFAAGTVRLPVPAARPLPFGAGALPGGMTARELAYADAQLTRTEAAYKKTAGAAKKLSDAQRELNAETGKAFKFSQEAGQGWEEYAGAVQGARMELEAFIATQPDPLIGATHPLSSITSGPYLYQVSGNMTGGVLNGTRQIATATKDWRVEVQGAARAFAQLAQIAGPSLSGVTRGIGTAIAAADVAQQSVLALASLVKGLTTTNAAGETTLTGRGAALAGGLAGAGIGAQFGAFIPQSRWGALGAGVAGGAVSGGMATGWNPYGIGAGAVIGGISAVLTSGAMAHAQNVAKDVQLEQLIAQFGSLDEVLAAAGRAGLDQQRILQGLWGDTEAFAHAVSDLNAALTQEKRAADALAKELQDVARVQGVLSDQQLAHLGTVGRGGPGEAVVEEFLRGQTAQAEAGILSTIAALQTYGDRALLDFKGAAQGAAAGLAALFGEALKTGESAVSILSRLGSGFATLQKLYDQQGVAPNPAFARISDLAGIASGAQTGPAVQMAAGLGQALAGFANTGMFKAMPELFGDIANGIGSAWRQLELFGAGGQRGAALFQPYLQTLDEMIRANPVLEEQLDDQTRALLAFARANGIVGPEFEDSGKKMQKALDLLIEKIGDLIDKIGLIPGINIPVTYTPGELPPPAPGTPGGPPSGRPPDPMDPGSSVAMALGGIVTRPMRALIGEAGPEAVIPLSRLGRGGAPIQITVISQIDGYEAARAITRYQPAVYRTYGAA